jgi:hypothetical protein
MRAELRAGHPPVLASTSVSSDINQGLSSLAPVSMPFGRSSLNSKQNSVPVATSGPSSDFQSQMLTLLTEIFSKMMTLSTESKSEWPKFNV